jgi:hypothetical protein
MDAARRPPAAPRDRLVGALLMALGAALLLLFAHPGGPRRAGR